MAKAVAALNNLENVVMVVGNQATRIAGLSTIVRTLAVDLRDVVTQLRSLRSIARGQSIVPQTPLSRCPVRQGGSPRLPQV